MPKKQYFSILSLPGISSMYFVISLMDDIRIDFKILKTVPTGDYVDALHDISCPSGLLHVLKMKIK